MCGLTGFWDFNTRLSKAERLALIHKMSTEIAHRGPDSFGAWCSETLGLALGHQRLAIVDLSEAGYQPMVSHSGRLVIVYNGEVYNTAELRETLILQGCQFKGHSDTEVIVEACEKWGVETTCQRLIGMFAFALWDEEKKRLFLVRDRLGIKPLYWGFNQGVLFFGSQLKSFSVHPAWKPEINKEALVSYFRFNYIPTPLSIFKGIFKLLPGTVLSIDLSKNIKETQFWDLQKVVLEGQRNINKTEDAQLVEELEVLLKDAVKRRMIADVPLGAFLSGGVDSSTVAALMQTQSTDRIQTFSIGFHETEYDESKYAARVAKHLGTLHREFYVNAHEAQAVIPDIPNWCDEPFADVSQIPTFLVSKLARQFVTVSLSGDGGDELFAGYHRYFIGQNIWVKLKKLPFWLRRLGAYGIRQLSPSHWEYVSKVVPKRFQVKLMGDKIYKFADVLTAIQPLSFYKMLVSHWDEPAALVLGGEEKLIYPWIGLEHPFDDNKQLVEIMQMMDLRTYLLDDILTKVDRASMAVGLEARVPLLDHRVVEFSWRLPLHAKIRANEGKWLLKRVLDRYVPRSLIERPKMGFGVPIAEWLRGPLREWGENLLSASRLQQEGVLNTAMIRNRWDEHLAGRHNWQYSLWGILMFQAWQERWMK
jgi:asparagine synthase (glutamine-hydrolysing)